MPEDKQVIINIKLPQSRLSALNAYVKEMGWNRSAALDLAISEFLQKRDKVTTIEEVVVLRKNKS